MKKRRSPRHDPHNRDSKFAVKYAAIVQNVTTNFQTAFPNVLEPVYLEKVMNRISHQINGIVHRCAEETQTCRMASNILQRSLISAFDRSGVARENIEKYIIGLETQIFKELTAEFKAKGLEAIVLTDHAESLHQNIDRYFANKSKKEV